MFPSANSFLSPDSCEKLNCITRSRAPYTCRIINEIAGKRHGRA